MNIKETTKWIRDRKDGINLIINALFVIAYCVMLIVIDEIVIKGTTLNGWFYTIGALVIILPYGISIISRTYNQEVSSDDECKSFVIEHSEKSAKLLDDQEFFSNNLDKYNKEIKRRNKIAKMNIPTYKFSKLLFRDNFDIGQRQDQNENMRKNAIYKPVVEYREKSQISFVITNIIKATITINTIFKAVEIGLDIGSKEFWGRIAVLLISLITAFAGAMVGQLLFATEHYKKQTQSKLNVIDAIINIEDRWNKPLSFDKEASERLINAYETQESFDPSTIKKDDNEITFDELINMSNKKD